MGEIPKWHYVTSYWTFSLNFIVVGHTCLQPKTLSSFNDEQLSTINPRASLLILRHHDISKLNNFLERLASDKAVFGPTCQISLVIYKHQKRRRRRRGKQQRQEGEVAEFQITIPLSYYSVKVPSKTLQNFLEMLPQPHHYMQKKSHIQWLLYKEERTRSFMYLTIANKENNRSTRNRSQMNEF